MGHEAVGIVHTVGDGVTRLQPGDRVVAACMLGCGRCRQCMRGEYSACGGGGHVMMGCQADYYRVPFADVNTGQVPDGVSAEHAVLVSDILSTGYGAIERAEARMGDSVAIFAQGPVGLCVTAGARARGCGLVIAVDTLASRLEMSKRLGANVVIDASQSNPVEEIMKLTGGEGVDVAVEAVGTQDTFQACTQVVGRSGHVSSVGVYGLTPEVSMQTLLPSFLHRHVVTTLCPSGWERMEKLLAQVKHGNVDLSPLFTHRMSLQQLPEAYELFRSRDEGVLKIAITP
jgi:threonine dehydrogenase-like Zn-dependent dehydrogenase